MEQLVYHKVSYNITASFTASLYRHKKEELLRREHQGCEEESCSHYVYLNPNRL